MAPGEALFLEGDGEVRALIRAMDWSRNPLGEPANWSLPLRTTVSTCLASRYPMFLWWGPDLINIYNDAYAPLMGSKHPEGMGRPAWEVWAEIWDIVGPLAMGVIERAEATWSAAQRLDMERAGYAEETYFDFAYSPVLAEDGSVAGILGVVSEITQRILGERRLQALSEIAARTHGIDGVYEVARAAVAALEADRADLPFALLYERAEPAEGRVIASIGDGPGGRTGLGSLGAALLGPGKAVELALTGREPVVLDPLPSGRWASEGTSHPDADKALVLPIDEPGEPAPTLALVCGLSAHRALDADLLRFCQLVAAAIGSAVGDARALEEERARTEALAELDRAKTEFFSNVSHEFRTPLTLLLGPLEEAARRPNPDPELVMAHRNALRLLRHVNTLLEYSRLQAQRTEVNPRPIDLTGTCTALTGVFRSAVERAGLELELECQEGPVPALADPDQLEQVILNLLSNALKFTLRGRITVRVFSAEDHAGIAVSDTGIGIRAEDLGRLFERFHRIEDAEARSHEGSGIGLALAKELVELQGGELEVASEVGRGSTFTVRLPAAAGEDELIRPVASAHAEAFLTDALRWSEVVEAEAAERRPAAESRPADAATVLVVDDNADMREYLSRLLSQRFEVRVATDGAEALEMLSQDPADLVLSDVMMPRLDGFGLLKAIRGDESLSATPVVLLSARAGEEAAVEGLDTGADDYVVKPFTARELLARVRANLELGAMRNREAKRAAEYAERLEELLQRERTIAVTLQRSMLPDELDAGAFTRIAARYEPAMEAMQVGGDFYDVLTLPDGGLLLFIGDVAGHGLESAIVMGAMRAALRAYVLSHSAPDRVLADMNTFAVT